MDQWLDQMVLRRCPEGGEEAETLTHLRPPGRIFDAHDTTQGFCPGFSG